jgi:hypothetical protein
MQSVDIDGEHTILSSSAGFAKKIVGRGERIRWPFLLVAMFCINFTGLLIKDDFRSLSFSWMFYNCSSVWWGGDGGGGVII